MPYTGSYHAMSETSRQAVAKRKRVEPTTIPGDFKFPDGRSRGISNKSGKSSTERLQQFTTRDFGKPSLNRAQLSNTMTEDEFRGDLLTVTHKCHKYNCVNPDHIYMAPLDVDRGMNGSLHTPLSSTVQVPLAILGFVFC